MARLRKGQISMSSAIKANEVKDSCVNLFQLLCDVQTGKIKPPENIVEFLKDQQTLASYKNSNYKIVGCSKGSLLKYANEYFDGGLDELNILTRQLRLFMEKNEQVDAEQEYFNVLDAYLDLLSICEKKEIKHLVAHSLDKHLNRYGFLGREKAVLLPIKSKGRK